MAATAHDAGAATLHQAAERALAEMGGDDAPAAPVVSIRRGRQGRAPASEVAPSAGGRSAGRRAR
jgi:hypothetical protein